MMEQILGFGFSLVISVFSTIAMVIAFGIRPIKWIIKSART